ncbi:serine/threonine protein kinase [Massilia sp. KIM]|uniref:protein kinase domain-containing protein n=1 Tax=Massilia sp. KIM TaxID=1955422 RepID=UPI00099023E7|nr:protein kinase [Massilia sp. KIM]OON63310.1 serine/threonine protein kinase [Massilia sp. KIM]
MVEAGNILTLAGGRYRLSGSAPLAGSAYGLVWRAEALERGEAVAIKLVNHEQMARAPQALRARWIESARTEIAFLRTLAPWDGRHIVRLLDSGEHEDLPAMALELLDGDLAAYLKAEQAAGRQIAPAQALDWIAQVNQALAKVHAAGWRYLDLKPANLLIDRRTLQLRLADFGTNRRLDDLAAHSYAGTANWQAPEQFFPDASGYRTGASADYFALGALLYYLVSGRLLRYGAACGEAYRLHGRDAAGLLDAAGARPAILEQDEAALFARQAGAAAAPALRLLRALLAPQPAARPRHALDISRLLMEAGAALRAQAPHPALRSAA